MLFDYVMMRDFIPRWVKMARRCSAPLTKSQASVRSYGHMPSTINAGSFVSGLKRARFCCSAMAKPATFFNLPMLDSGQAKSNHRGTIKTD